MKLRNNVDTINDMMQNSFRCVLLIADGVSVQQIFFCNGYVNGVGGQGSRSADIAFLCLVDGYLMGSAVRGLAQHVSHSFGCLMAM